MHLANGNDSRQGHPPPEKHSCYRLCWAKRKSETAQYISPTLSLPTHIVSRSEQSNSVTHASETGTQVPWLESKTIRDNILFYEPFEPERYTRIVQACALNEDLAQFPQGDRTEIGERGESDPKALLGPVLMMNVKECHCLGAKGCESV